jgi:uncharacterized membrane protein
MPVMRLTPLVLALLLAGCPQPKGTEAAAPRSAAIAAPASDSARPAAPAPSAVGLAAPAPQPANGQQGIRIGEPAPGSSRGPRPAPGSTWHAFGNEPFWSVQARGGTLVFMTPENQGGTTLLGRRVPSLVGTVIIGSGPDGEFHLGITPGECSDGMSDQQHAYASTFNYGGTTYKGCADAVGP